MNLEIRRAESEDIDKVLELQSSSIRLMSRDYSPIQIEALVKSQASARLAYDEIVFLAFYQDELVGFGCFITKTSYLSGLYVHPKFVRQGIGTQLLEVIERTVLEKGCKFIFIESSLTAVKFYQKKGYQVIRKSGFFSDSSTWIPCINLRKPLLPVAETEPLNKLMNCFNFWLSGILLVHLEKTRGSLAGF